MSQLLLPVLVLLLACGETDPAPATEGNAAPAADGSATAPVTGAAPTEGAAAAQAVPADAPAAQRLLGEWNIVLGPQELRQVELLKLALKDPAPSEEELTKANLSSEEKTMVMVMASARAANPTDPKITEMRSAAEGLATASVVFTADTMTFKAGPVTEQSAYTVLSQTESSLVVRSPGEVGPDGAPATPEDATITFDGPDAILLADMADPSNSQRFTRKK